MITNFQTNPGSELRHFKRNGSVYFELYFQCPVCLQNGINNVPVTYWYHNSCKAPQGRTNRIFIGDDGNYICEYCEHSEVIVLWAYHCPIHEGAGIGRYVRVTNSKTLAKVISIAGMMAEAAGTSWLIEVLKKIKDQFEDPQYR